MRRAADTPIQRLIDLMAKLPGLGPRSARRAVLTLVKRRERLLLPLAEAMRELAERVRVCSVCGNADTQDPCAICADGTRSRKAICVVQDVGDLWAMERSGIYAGQYHVLGGVLSPLDGVGPGDLGIPRLVARAKAAEVVEVILALGATVDGQTTAHYVAAELGEANVRVTSLAQGVPVGGELDFLDDGTIMAALSARRELG